MKVYWLPLIPLTEDQRKLIYALHGEGMEIETPDPKKEKEHSGPQTTLVDQIKEHSDGIVYVDAEGPELVKAQAAGCRFRIFSCVRGGDGRVELVVLEINPQSIAPAEPDPIELSVPIPAEI